MHSKPKSYQPGDDALEGGFTTYEVVDLGGALGPFVQAVDLAHYASGVGAAAVFGV